jgi:hypothetical protein
MDGYTRSCCCNHEQGEQGVSGEPAFERPSCCDAVPSIVVAAPPGEQRQTQTVAKQTPPQPALDLPRALPARAELAFAPVLCVGALVDGPRATTGPPLFLRHHALLI